MTGLLDEVRRARRLPPPATAKAVRLEAGLIQQRLADEVGVHRVTLSRWESGIRRPRGAQRDAYSDVLHQLQRALSAP